MKGCIKGGQMRRAKGWYRGRAKVGEGFRVRGGEKG